MLKRTKKALSSKKGEAYIYVCVLVIFMSMLVSVIVLYMGLLAQVQIQKRDVEMKLDSCIADYATQAFDAIKQGDSYESVLDLAELKSSAYQHLGFDSDQESLTYDNGNCTMTKPEIVTLTGNGFGVRATYVAIFPVRWGGNTYANIEIPITVTSYYKFK